MRYPINISLILCVSLAAIAQAKPKIFYDNDLGTVSLKNRKLYKYHKSKMARMAPDDAVNMAKVLVGYTESPITADVNAMPGYDEEELDRVALKSDVDPTSYVEVTPELGEIQINGGFARYQRNAKTSRLVKKGQAKKMLQRHLDNLGLSLDKNQIQDVYVGGLNMAVHHENGKSEDFEKFTVVRVSRQLDNLPVFGASRVVARLAEDGRLHSLVYRWADVNREEITNDELIDDERVANLIAERVAKKGKRAKEIRIKVREIGLYDDGNGTIEPVVMVAGMGNYGEGGTNGEKQQLKGTIDFCIPLLKDSKLELPADGDNHIPLPKQEK